MRSTIRALLSSATSSGSSRGSTPAGGSSSSKIKDTSPILTVFDLRRGQREGDEADKILGFYPTHLDRNAQTGVVGFAEAANTFFSNFSEEKPVHSIVTKHQRWVLTQVEPSIFFMLIVRRASSAGEVREEALQQMLHRVHSIVCLDNKSIQCMLDADPTGEAARQCLQGLLADVGAAIAVDKGREVTELANPLSQRSSCATLRVPREAFSCMQTLLSSILTSYGGKAVHGVTALFDRHLIWSTLTAKDTAVLYQLALSAFHGKKKKASNNGHSHAQRQSPHWQPDCWEEVMRGFYAMKSSAWRGAANGAVLGQQAPPHGLYAARFPRVFVSQGEQTCLVTPYMQDGLLLLLLINDWVDPSDEMLSGLAGLMRPKACKLASMCHTLISSYKDGHVAGYRYLYESCGTLTAQGSPAPKVATLSKESTLMISSIRSSLEQQRFALATMEPHLDSIYKSNMSSWELLPSEPRELIVESANGCWLVVRQSGPRRLFCIMESGQDNMLAASEAASTFVNLNYPGLFET